MEQNRRAKEPWFGVFLNQIFPGLGEIYVQRLLRGFIIIIIALLFLGALFGAIYIIVSPRFIITGPLLSEGLVAVIIFAILEFIFRVFVAIDGYLCVRKYNLTYRLKPARPGLQVFSIISSIVLFFLCIYYLLPLVYIRTSIVGLYKTPTISMIPAVMPQDRIVVDKRAYLGKSPQRLDIVLFLLPQDRTKYYFKRVMGLPGETLAIKDGNIYINGKILEEPSAVKNFYYNDGKFGEKGIEVKIPEGSYYVLGDNSVASLDSRFFGFVPRKDIKGKVIKIFWPPDRSGKVN